MTSKQLNIIRNYLQQFEMDYIDLQTELIDHFASAVSHLQEKQPELSFQQALLLAHQKFGGKAGFLKYRLAAENRVEKKIAKTMGRMGLSLLAWPSVLKVLLALVLAWLSVVYIPNSDIRFVGLIALLLIQALYLHARWRKTKYFLVKRSIRSLGMYLYFLIYLPYSNLLLFAKAGFNTHLILTSLMLLFFLVVQNLPAKLQIIAEEQYPNGNLAIN